MGVTTRFAPSPTGLLHLGHVFAALCAWRAARDAGGCFLVRIEDIDPARCRPDFARAAIEDLTWLGLAPDGPVRVQSAHLDAYGAALAGLAARGLAYPCFCSRAEVAREVAASAAALHGNSGAAAPHGTIGAARPQGNSDAAAPYGNSGAAVPHGPDGGVVYPGTCRRLAPSRRVALLAGGAPHAWRLDMAAALAGAPALRFHERGQGWVAADPAPFGDVVLGRRDAPASYHLCVTHDDALQGVTLVTRAEDLRPATHLHVLLQHVLGFAVPDYAHHALLRGPDGARLAKRTGAEPVRALRARGLAAAEVIALAGQMGTRAI
jgi:glutamyl-Q tRNA(Asp) synthetase